MSDACKTRYPILLVHGIGLSDHRWFNYWGRIPKALENEGAVLFYGKQSAWGSIESNALFLKGRVEAILKETKAAKVNIIAHSKGGLESRYLISTLGMGGKIASLTTVATPHQGSKIMDLYVRSHPAIPRFAAFFLDFFSRTPKTGREDPIVRATQTSPEAMERFNRANPDFPGTFYQSYVFMMQSPRSDAFFRFRYPKIKALEGDNDGLVSVESAKWGEFHGPFHGAGIRGISHLDEIDFRRRNLSAKKGTPGITDIRHVYAGIAAGLKAKGF
jgi:triacylglycerol lipase